MMQTDKHTATKRTNGGLNSVSAPVSALVKRIVGKKGFMIADILTFWDKIVGTELAAYTLPERIEFKKGDNLGGIIHIVVPGGAFALEIQHKERFLLEKINSYFGYAAISGMRIIQDANFRVKTDEINLIKSKKSLVSPEEQNYIERMADEIESPELKEVLVRLGQSVFNQNNE